MAISTTLQGARSNPELRTRATQALQQTAQQKLDLPQEQTNSSDEFLDELSKAAQSRPGDGLEALLSAVTQNFVDRKAGEAEQDQQKKMEVEWAPEVRPGEIMAPQGYTGQLIYKESKDQPKTNKLAATPSPKKPGNKQTRPDDSVELTAESQKMTHKMQQGGMQPAGMNSKVAKPEERVDVFMPTAGVTQLVEVSPAGQLRADGLLGTYRKLDDMPSFNGAILRKRTGKELLEENRAQLQRGEKVDPLSQVQQQQLLNPIATHQ